MANTPLVHSVENHSIAGKKDIDAFFRTIENQVAILFFFFSLLVDFDTTSAIWVTHFLVGIMQQLTLAFCNSSTAAQLLPKPAGEPLDRGQEGRRRLFCTIGNQVTISSERAFIMNTIPHRELEPFLQKLG